MAHHILIESYSFQEVLFGVVAHSLLLYLELDGHRVVLPAAIVASEYEDVVRFFWSAGSA